MSFYRDRVLPVITDVALSGKPNREVRARIVTDLQGEVVEIGFGSGRNVPFYPDAVTRVRAVEPAAGGRRIAAKRIAASTVPVEFVGLDGASLPLDDDSVDHVLTTWTLCTIPDVERALGEVVRVLRPGGTLRFAEHGRSPDPRVARWQDRLNPVQKKVFGGCHLNRKIDDLLTTSGLHLTALRNYALPGPQVFGYMYEGVAAKP
ncbi:MAG TPA: class I SAM-dependent methyltransferase [Acidimicrobiales bacterium]|nr:class I SAM-dependent methyltransferase [Acidimicrobiales bacterium]